jgi:probable F420-dependent oxidoreductase
VSPSPLKLGVAIGAYSAGVPGARDVADFARTAEAVGFDSVQVGDHIQWHQPILESTVLMATFAAATSRIRIASDVVILPLRDPVLIAKTVASLDVLSGGRMIFGVGVGGDHPAEYAAMRVPLRERGARTDEGLEIVRGLFTSERFSYAGRHFSIDDVAIAPRPLQARLPIWIGGTSDAALRRAARHGDGWIPAFASERKFARLAETLRGFLAEERRSPADFTWGSFLFVNVDEDGERARSAGAEYVDRVYHLDGAAIMERFGAAGPVAAVAERVRAFAEAGADYVVLSPVCGYRDWPRQLDACGEVIARLGAARGVRGEAARG